MKKKRVRPNQSEVFRLRCNNRKLKKLTNWKPKYSINKGLHELIKWLSDEENIKNYKINEYNI